MQRAQTLKLTSVVTDLFPHLVCTEKKKKKQTGCSVCLVPTRFPLNPRLGVCVQLHRERTALWQVICLEVMRDTGGL